MEALLLFAVLPFTAETETSRAANSSTANRSHRGRIGSAGQGVSSERRRRTNASASLATGGTASGRREAAPGILLKGRSSCSLVAAVSFAPTMRR